MSRKKIILICIGILLLGTVLTSLIFFTEPTAQQEGASKKMAMLVETMEAQKGDFQPVFKATGTVSPVEDIVLSPLVSGQVISRSPQFTPGGFVDEGTVLLQIDPSDYRNTLELRKSELQQAQTNLDVELGRQQVAKKDLALIGGDTLSSEEKALVLRQPQLSSVKANITAARAAVDQARLNLARTQIRAPFDAHILSQNVTEGSQVAPGDNLGRLVGTDHYWVTLTIPVEKLRWLDFATSQDHTGSPVKISNTTAWPEDVFRQGFLDRQVGALDAQTRLARVLVTVPDPLARKEENKEKPELMIGSFVEASLLGKPIEEVIKIHRDQVRTNNTVWVMQDGKLQIRDVEILLKDSEHAYVTKGLEQGDRIVTTNLSTVAEGLALRTKAADSSAASGTAEE